MIALRPLNHGLTQFVDKLSGIVSIIRAIDADRRELVERLKPFHDAYLALPEAVREADMRRRAELEARLRAPLDSPRVVVMIGDVSLTVEHLFQAALVYQKHVESNPT